VFEMNRIVIQESCDGCHIITYELILSNPYIMICISLTLDP
jgi:hypothetical protein